MAEHKHVDPAPLATGTVPRRAFLAGTGLVAVSAATAAAGAPLFGPRTAAAHDDCACLTAWQGVWSLARLDSGYVAMAGEVDSKTLEIHDLLVAPDRTVTLGGHRDVEFPDHFMPAVLHGMGTRLLVGGAKVVEAQRITADYSITPSLVGSPLLSNFKPEHAGGIHEISIHTYQPALYEINGKQLTELPLGDVAGTLGWGTVTNIVTVPGSGLAVRIEGSGSHQQAYCERVVVAESADGGATWFGDTVATGLGEGWPGGLVVSGGALVTIAVDQTDRRTVHQRAIGTRGSWTGVDAGQDGTVLGAVAGRDGSVVVFGSGGDQIVRQQYNSTGRQLSSTATAAAAGRTTHAVMTVGGAPTEWLAINQESARLINETA